MHNLARRLALLAIYILAGIGSFSQCSVAVTQKTAAEPKAADCPKPQKTWKRDEKKLWASYCKFGIALGGDAYRYAPVTGDFLKEVLTKSPYREKIAEQGILFYDVKIVGGLDIEKRSLKGDIEFEDFYADTISFRQTTIDGSLRFANGTATDILLDGAHIKGDLSFASFGPTYDSYAVPRPCNVPSLYALNAKSMTVDGNALLSNINFLLVDMSGSHINGRLSTNYSRGNSLNYSNAVIGGSVDLSWLSLIPSKKWCATEETSGYLNPNGDYTNLTGMLAKSDVNLTASDIGVPVDMAGATVGGSLVFDGAKIRSPMSLFELHIARQLRLQDGEYLDAMTKKNTLIELGWLDDASLDLRDAVVGSIVAPRVAKFWPTKEKLDIRNLSFTNFVSEAFETDVGMQTTPEWFPFWLQLSPPKTRDSSFVVGQFNPQPYEQVRLYLTAVGDLDAAKAVGIAGKDLERHEVCASLWPISRAIKCTFLAASWAAIGYGYAVERAFYWAIFFIITGAIVFANTNEARRFRMPVGLAYSFDMFIPLIRLREKHYKIDVKSAARYYFYVHKIAGWVLSSFIVAGLAGLTK